MGDTSHQETRPGGRASFRPRFSQPPKVFSRAFWVDRLVGLGLVLLGATMFYAVTVPNLFDSSLETALLAIAGVLGTGLGMPLLVTGRIQRPR